MMKKAKQHIKTPHRINTANSGAWVLISLFVLLTLAALSGTRDQMAESRIEHDKTTRNPAQLSATDRALYHQIKTAQQSQDFAQADQWIGQLQNRGLVGYVLAERYLAPGYLASKEEITQWLNLYADHPQASSINALASTHGLVVNLPKTVALRGEGYGDHEGRNSMPDRWFTALGHWRAEEYDAAQAIFVEMTTAEGLSDWQRAATHYWAYRSANKLGDNRAARAALTRAATFPTTFYGLLAMNQLGLSSQAAEAPEVSPALRNDPKTIRAALLIQLDRTAEAETELRALYSATPAGSRSGVVTLASEMNLPNLQMRLASMKELSDPEALFARYPMPQYMVDLDPVMDAALLLAVARNESGFRAGAFNPSGATGMMQMLPSTARMVEKRVGETLLQTASNDTSASTLATRLSNPSLSARYGAEYLRILTQTPAIQTNLVHLLVGYNAGPGTAIQWKKSAEHLADPLLYIESIPYAETRNYVMQVSAQYWIYQAMMDETPTSLNALARGEWPLINSAHAAS